MSEEQNKFVQGWKKEIDETLRVIILAPLSCLDNTIPKASLPTVQYTLLKDLHDRVLATGNPEIIAYYKSKTDKIVQGEVEIQADIKRTHEQYWQEIVEKYPKSAGYTGEEKERVFGIRDEIESLFKEVRFLAGKRLDDPAMAKLYPMTSLMYAKDIKLTYEEVINLIQSRIGALELKVQVVDDPWLTDCLKEKNTTFSSEWMQKLYQKNLAEKNHIGVKDNASEISDESVSVPNLANSQQQESNTSDVLTVAQKIRKILKFKPKNHKEPPEPEAFHMDFVGGQNFEDADCIFGIDNITKDISAAVIQLCPAGTINEQMRSGKATKLTWVKKAIIEISTEAKYDYKEMGMWSKWPEPRTIHYSEDALKNNEEPSLSVSSEIPCKFVLLESPALVEIELENELVYNFFKNKFMNKSVKTGDTIVLRIAGNNLSFSVGYAFPEEFVRIDENTQVSYIISSNQTTKVYPTWILNKYIVRMHPFPSEEFMPKIPSRYKDAVQGGQNKQYMTYIQDYVDYIKPLTKII